MTGLQDRIIDLLSDRIVNCIQILRDPDIQSEKPMSNNHLHALFMIQNLPKVLNILSDHEKANMNEWWNRFTDTQHKLIQQRHVESQKLLQLIKKLI